jgi:hypothetical protein
MQGTRSVLFTGRSLLDKLPPLELHSPGHCIQVWTTHTKNKCAREG